MNHVKSFIQGSVYTTLLALIQTIKVSFIVGSKMAFFSATHCLSPLLGMYTGFTTLSIAFCMRTALSFWSTSILPCHLLVYHIPSFCAALYFAHIVQNRPTNLTRAILAAIPLLAALLFVLHPVGRLAVPYTFLWLIPLFSSLIPHQQLFIHALASTCIAHAVGSVIWLYSIGPVSPEAWLALIPAACFERLLFASGMTLCMYAVAWALDWARSFSGQKTGQKTCIQNTN